MMNFSINYKKIQELIRKNSTYKIVKSAKHIKTTGFLIVLALLTSSSNMITIRATSNINNSVISEVDYDITNNESITLKSNEVTQTPKAEEKTVQTHVVKSGETLSKIAAKYGTIYQELAKINNIINPNSIKIGQIIKLTPEAKITETQESKSNKETNQAPKKTVKKEKKRLALTFDDGPGKYTDELLDILAEHNVKATFFIQGSNVKVYSDVIKRMYKEGHQIANHTYGHENLNTLSTKEALSTINKTQKVLKGLGVEPSAYFRPPYGNMKEDKLKAVDDFISIYWGTDTLDWKYKDSDILKDILINDLKNEDIVLMHDIHKTTVEGVKKALPKMIEKGYEFYTLEDLFEVNDKNVESGILYKSGKKTK